MLEEIAIKDAREDAFDRVSQHDPIARARAAERSHNDVLVPPERGVSRRRNRAQLLTGAAMVLSVERAAKPTWY